MMSLARARLLRSLYGWDGTYQPAGTTGIVIDHSDGYVSLEIIDQEGHTIDLVDAPAGDVEYETLTTEQGGAA